MGSRLAAPLSSQPLAIHLFQPTREHTTSNWQVLLIGGSSGTGKTRVARELSGEFGVSLLQVDDIRLAVQAATTPLTNPELHTFVSPDPEAFDSAASVFRGLRDVAEAMEPALRAVMSHHVLVDDAGPIVLEGDGVLPRLASTDYLSGQPEFPGSVDRLLVAGVFLIESDRDRLHANMRSRDRGFNAMSESEQSALAEGSHRFGQFLQDEARQFGVVAVEAGIAVPRLRALFEARQSDQFG